jgi:ceramide glucosyltransferase
MIHQVLRTIEFVAATATILSIAYYLVCLWSAASFVRGSSPAGKRARPTQDCPPVSILKPLKGTDPEMYECFRSHCLQEYSAYEIIFGVSDADDPAIELVERLRAEFPQHDIRLVHCSQNLGSNIKVSNLVQMLPHARCEYIIVNDSDIRVPPDYLGRVLAPLADSAVGLVTCPYRGVPNETLASQLESLGISTDFFPGVLVARNIEGINFGLGSTLAFRRRDLEAIGGFAAIIDYLADDYEIGLRMAARGLRIELSDVIVDSLLPRYTIKSFFDHQLRWARTVKNVRLWGYVGLVITFGLPWALLTLILARGATWAWLLFAITVLMRFGLAAYISKKVLREAQTNLLWWLPLRDILALCVWVTSLTGDTVIWRGTPYRLKQGKLAKMAP